MTDDYEAILDKFIEEERAKSRMGSGDDMAYEQQIMDYVDKQRKLWIAFMKFIEKKLKKEKVSLEWLEKWCKKHELTEVRVLHNPNTLPSADLEMPCEKLVCVIDLLSAAKKEAAERISAESTPKRRGNKKKQMGAEDKASYEAWKSDMQEEHEDEERRR